jgi:uncharacterized membrane protein YedE/YeeE
MHDFTPISALIGGALVGLSASLFLLTHGRVAGISGLYGGVLRRSSPDRALRLAFIAGLLLSGIVVRIVYPAAFETTWTAALPLALGAGLLVGFGTQLGNGCTSGHGVCGISRLSARSLVATGTFMAAGIATTFVVRHVLGGGQ